MLNFVTGILGDYAPVLTEAGASVNFGWIFDAIGVLFFAGLIFRVIFLIVKAVFYK
jgi:hypothetical protein